MSDKLRYFTILGMILVTTLANSADLKELSCRATKNGAEHVAKIVMSPKGVESFFYGSMNKNGDSCELFGARNEKATSWIDEGDGKTLVSVFAGEDEVGKVLIQFVDSKFTMKIITPLGPRVCGVEGDIAKTVIINDGSKVCVLKD